MTAQRSISNGSNSSNSTNGSSGSRKRSPVFPKRLYDLLENAERDGYAHVISWTPDGKSFKIHVDGSMKEEDERELVAILKKNFNQTRFKSFLRQLQLYGFERTYKGPQRGLCKHRLFVRGRRDLIHKKSIEDFQNNTNNVHRGHKHAPSGIAPVPLSEVAAISSFASKPYSENNNTCNSKARCQYLYTSVIPTRLTNLVLLDLDNDSKDEYDDDLASINSGVWN